MGWLNAFKKKKAGDDAAKPGLADEFVKGRDFEGTTSLATGAVNDDLEARIRQSMKVDRRPAVPSADIRQIRDTPWGPARPYWVIDSSGFRRSFSQLAYGTELKLQIHGQDGDHGRAGRVRVTREGKTVGYLSSGTSRRYLPILALAESIDAHLTVEGVVADYHGESSLTVFLPSPEVMEGVISNAAPAAKAGE